jgi:predicted flap endonuclease-1-like 5' DNA nuclease
MSLLVCCFWWCVLGVLIGWLLSWLFNRLFGRSDVQATVAAAVPSDDLVIIEGIGPRIAALLRKNDVDTFETLARMDAKSIWSILERGGPRFKLANNPGTWPEQAAYCVRGDWDGLKRWQDDLYAGLRVVPDVPAAAEIDLDAARAAGFDVKNADDLEVVEGIGPKTAGLLREHGISSLARLAAAAPSDIRAILDRGGASFRIAEPATWPEQAGYCLRNDWAGLKTLQDRLNAGRE